MKFYGKWNRPEKKPEINSGKPLVETAGYIPPQQQIENIILAGKRLEDYRRENYDFAPGTVDTDGIPRKKYLDKLEIAEVGKAFDKKAKQFEENQKKLVEAKKKEDFENAVKEETKKRISEQLQEKSEKTTDDGTT